MTKSYGDTILYTYKFTYPHLDKEIRYTRQTRILNIKTPSKATISYYC